MYAVCEVGDSREGGGVDEGVGGVGVLATAGFGGNDFLIVGPHVGAGEPDGVGRSVVFGRGDDGGKVAG